MRSINTESQLIEYRELIARAVARNLDSQSIFLGPILMTISMILAIVAMLADTATSTVIVSITVTIGLIGGYLYFHTLLVLNRGLDLLLEREPATINYIGKAALYTATYYLVIGALLTVKFLTGIQRTLRELHDVDSNECEIPKTIMVFITLGSIVGKFSHCIARSLILILDSLGRNHITAYKDSESLSTETN